MVRGCSSLVDNSVTHFQHTPTLDNTVAIQEIIPASSSFQGAPWLDVHVLLQVKPPDFRVPSTMELAAALRTACPNPKIYFLFHSDFALIVEDFEVYQASWCSSWFHNFRHLEATRGYLW